MTSPPIEIGKLWPNRPWRNRPSPAPAAVLTSWQHRLSFSATSFFMAWKNHISTWTTVCSEPIEKMEANVVFLPEIQVKFLCGLIGKYLWWKPCCWSSTNWIHLDSTMGPEAIGGSFSTNHGCSTSSGKPRVRFGQLVSSLWKQFWNCLEIQNSWREGVISISRFLTGSPNLATKKNITGLITGNTYQPQLGKQPVKNASRSRLPLMCLWVQVIMSAAFVHVIGDVWVYECLFKVNLTHQQTCL